jgi:Brp/Blh family beta-carotene 15,15'-monooxygenase
MNASAAARQPTPVRGPASGGSGGNGGDDFHRRVVFLPVVAVTLGVAAASLVVTVPDSISVAVVVVTVALLGIPHGAVDHLVAAKLGGPFNTSSLSRFTRDYVLAMLGVGVVWLSAPTLALVAFLLLSIHHFGQSDLGYLGLSARRGAPVWWSRGLLLVGLPLVAHLNTVSPVIERLGGGDPAKWAWLADRWELWSAMLVAQHVVIGWALTRRRIDRPTLINEAITVAALTTLFLSADPLVGFAVYFGLWHSLNHLFVLADLLGTQPVPLRSVVRLAIPLSALSLLGIVAVVVGAVATNRTDLIVPLTFVFVSMLTLPHMLVVERIWGSRTLGGASTLAPKSSTASLPRRE